jgi:hypothetical protein
VKENRLADQGVDGRMDLRGVGWGTDWIHLAQDRDKWRAVVNAVMNLRFAYNARNFLSS